MRDSPEMAAARIEAERARARLFGTIDELEEAITHFLHQLAPKHLMREAWDGAKEKGADLAEGAVDAVRARPLAATGVVAAITMFLAREPLMDLAGNFIDGIGGKQKSRKARKSRSRPAANQETETIE
jgi:hypothetical protein